MVFCAVPCYIPSFFFSFSCIYKKKEMKKFDCRALENMGNVKMHVLSNLNTPNSNIFSGTDFSSIFFYIFFIYSFYFHVYGIYFLCDSRLLRDKNREFFIFNLIHLFYSDLI